jgi:RNA polymerase sigma-70 factor (ECF subfamily)
MAAPPSIGNDPAVVEAVRAVLGGDNEAFAVIVRQYQGAIRTVATVILRDPQAALEVTEEVLVRVWQGLKSYDSTRSLKAWLMGITHRVASDYQQQRAGRARKERGYAQTGVRPAPEQPLDALLADERSRMLWQMVDGLPAGERVAIVLFYREGLSVEQVADTLGVSPGTVKTSLFRARKHLHAMMQGPERNCLESYV